MSLYLEDHKHPGCDYCLRAQKQWANALHDFWCQMAIAALLEGFSSIFDYYEYEKEGFTTFAWETAAKYIAPENK